MEAMQWLTLSVFALTILAVITNVVDSTLAALLGVAVMCWLGIMTETEAFNYVDWNVMAILVGIWIIAGYFGKSGVPSWLSVQALKLSGGRPGVLVVILTLLAGIISMFVDNVVTILMMAPVALPLARAVKLPPVPVILMIGFGANFMGTALLIGDLPPPFPGRHKRLTGSPYAVGQVAGTDHRTVAEPDRLFDDVLQLPHVARPAIARQRPNRLGGKRDGSA